MQKFVASTNVFWEKKERKKKRATNFGDKKKIFLMSPGIPTDQPPPDLQKDKRYG